MLANLVATMRMRRVRAWEITEVTGIGECQLSRAIHGHQKLDPVQRQRIAEYLRADVTWLFSTEFLVPPLGEVAVGAAASVAGRGG